MLPPDIADLCVGWKRAPGSSKSARLDEEAQPVAQFEPGPGLEAFEESQKYKEGKYIIEKAKMVKEGSW